MKLSLLLFIALVLFVEFSIKDAFENHHPSVSLLCSAFFTDGEIDDVIDPNSIAPDEQLDASIKSLPLPSDVGETIKLEVGGEPFKFDELGPIVVNLDGTLRRIENWAQMTEKEQIKTKHRIAKRNLQRLNALKELEKENSDISAFKPRYITPV